LNDHVSQVVSENPNRFVGLGTLPMQAPDLAVKELRRCVQDLGLCGVQIGLLFDLFVYVFSFEILFYYEFLFFLLKIIIIRLNFSFRFIAKQKHQAFLPLFLSFFSCF
jgi:hypothetical protein